MTNRVVAEKAEQKVDPLRARLADLLKAQDARATELRNLDDALERGRIQRAAIAEDIQVRRGRILELQDVLKANG